MRKRTAQTLVSPPIPGGQVPRAYTVEDRTVRPLRSLVCSPLHPIRAREDR